MNSKVSDKYWWLLPASFIPTLIAFIIASNRNYDSYSMTISNICGIVGQLMMLIFVVRLMLKNPLKQGKYLLISLGVAVMSFSIIYRLVTM